MRIAHFHTGSIRSVYKSTEPMTRTKMRNSLCHRLKLMNENLSSVNQRNHSFFDVICCNFKYLLRRRRQYTGLKKKFLFVDEMCLRMPSHSGLWLALSNDLTYIIYDKYRSVAFFFCTMAVSFSQHP